MSSRRNSLSLGANPVLQQANRFIVVANRLPINLSGQKGDRKFNLSSGGLVSALRGMKLKMPFVWIGWPGCEVDEDEQDQLRDQLYREISAQPVYLVAELVDKYYNGFCNNVLWPLFHYQPLPVNETQGRECTFDDALWHAYREANEKFAEAILKIYQPGDMVWIHDYHLMLLPQYLRQQVPEMLIGFFLHTPFPSSEIYRILPVRKQVLKAVLNADLIGFHTADYARHFLSVCSRVLSVRPSEDGVHYRGFYSHVGVFPIGIDPELFRLELQKDDVKKRIEELKLQFKDKKIIIGVDRLDPIKGLPHKLMGFEEFLLKYPEYISKVVLIQIAVPSRTDVKEYQKLVSQVNELVGRINGKYGPIESNPICYLNKSIPFNELTALYTIADVCLITSIRDGMNLVSYEYIAAQQEKNGVLILSEFAGSAQSLRDCIRINPWDAQEVAHSIFRALTMSEEEKHRRLESLTRYVYRNTASFWGENFLNELSQAKLHSPIPTVLPRISFEDAVSSLEKSSGVDRVVTIPYNFALSEAQT